MKFNPVRHSSCVGESIHHMMFKVKYCYPVFDIKEFREACKECFKKIALEHNINIESLGFDSNHIHMINELGKYSEPELRKIFKGTSGNKLLKQFPEIKQRYFWCLGLWGRQYYCYSIGSDTTILKNYVKKQKFFTVMHDKQQTTLDSY